MAANTIDLSKTLKLKDSGIAIEMAVLRKFYRNGERVRAPDRIH